MAQLFVQCGGTNLANPGCHRAVWRNHVDKAGLCCYCSADPKFRQDPSDAPSTSNAGPFETFAAPAAEEQP